MSNRTIVFPVIYSVASTRSFMVAFLEGSVLFLAVGHMSRKNNLDLLDNC